VNEQEKKGMCICKSCNRVFHQSEIKHIHKNLLGQQAIETVCPYCDHTYGLINYPISEYELTYKNNKFFGISKKQIKQYEFHRYISNK
jgi:uncharacterized Zn-finger protein